MLKIPLKIKSVKNPEATPKRNFKVFLYPKRLPLAMDIMLFGPGVKLIVRTYAKKGNNGNTAIPPQNVLAYITINA